MMKHLLYWARRGSLSVRTPGIEATSRSRVRQQGQALVLFSIFLTVIMGMAALVLDQGLLRKANTDLYNALDAGALAGVSLLKDDPAAAEKLAREYVQANYPGKLPDKDVNIGFRCLIGAEKGIARVTDVPGACDPGVGAAWTVDGDRAYATCQPSQGHVCNTLVVSGPAEVDFNFAPVLGILKGSTGARTAAACKGVCGEPPEIPVDLVMILDRTGSMNGVDTENSRRAADSVRAVYDPRLQWMSLGLLHRSQTVNGCITKADNSDPWSATVPGDLRRWVPIGLTGTGASFDSDYTADDSRMAKAIACFNNSGGQGTDLADPVRMATWELETNGRKNAVKAILLLSDGKPNNSSISTVRANRTYCADAYDAAAAAKAKGIEVFAVGFGLDVEQDHICQDQFGAWKDQSAPDLLAAMATDSKNNGCPGTENDDDDHYFCLPKTSGASADLSEVFKKAVTSLTSHSRLVDVN
jgi:hypothetical protein